MPQNVVRGNSAIWWVRRVCAGASLLLALAAGAVAAENTKKPISRERLFRAVEIGGLSTEEFVGIIREFGVEFELSAEDRQSLSKAGVAEPVMEALTANFRDPIREKVAQLAQGGPLAKDGIIGLLKAGAGSEIVELLVDKRGVSFAMTPAEAKEIEAAGGSKGLLGALLLKEPVKVAVAAQVPAGEVKEPLLVAAATPAATPVPPAEPVKIAAQAPTPQAVAPSAGAPASNAAARPINQAAALLTASAKPAKLIRGEVRYSEMARRVRASGKVLMEIVINERGQVEQVKGISGNPLLVLAATQSMRDWLYEPASVDGRPTKVSTQVSVDFHQ